MNRKVDQFDLRSSPNNFDYKDNDWSIIVLMSLFFHPTTPITVTPLSSSFHPHLGDSVMSQLRTLYVSIMSVLHLFHNSKLHNPDFKTIQHGICISHSKKITLYINHFPLLHNVAFVLVGKGLLFRFPNRDYESETKGGDL